MRPLFLTLGLFCAWPAAAAQSNQAANPLVYERQLDEARSLSSAGSWRKARKAWLRILDEHTGEEYVRPQLEEIRQGLERASFWSTTPEPSLGEHVSGKLQRHERSSGKVHILYTPETLGDFAPTPREEDVQYTHPAHFSGPWSVEFEGTPEVIAGSTWAMTDGETALAFQIGSREEDALVYTLHSALRLSPTSAQRLEAVDPAVLKRNAKKVRGRLDVRADRLELRVDGKRVLSIDREGADFGQLLWIAAEPPARIQIKGSLERGWLDSVRDAAVAAERASFEAAWQEPPQFTAWGARPVPREDEHDLRELASNLQVALLLEPQQVQIFEELQGHLHKGRRASQNVLTALESLPEGALPDDALAFLEVSCAIDLGRYQRALSRFDAMPASDDQLLARELLRAFVLEHAGRLDDARATLEELLVEHGREPSVHKRLVETLLQAARTVEARAALQRARETLPASGALRRLERLVVQAELGPEWKTVHEHVGEHFRVRSEASRRLCRQASQVLESTMARCEALFGPLPSNAPTSLAYVFAGELGYRAYVEEIADSSHESTLGIYSPLLKQVVVWNQADSAELWDVLRHECVHRYLDLRFGNVPRWLNEGLAELVAAQYVDEDTWRTGELRWSWLDLMGRSGGDVLDLRSFTYDAPQGFVDEVELNYGLSWAWLHHLSNTSEVGSRIFDELWAGLESGEDCATALEAALQGVDDRALHQEFVANVNAWIRAAAER